MTWYNTDLSQVTAIALATFIIIPDIVTELSFCKCSPGGSRGARNTETHVGLYYKLLVERKLNILY